MTPTHVVGISDCVVSDDPAATLITHALGSCIAIAIHDPLARVAGLLHYMLPNASMDPVRAQAKPFMFADTGIPILFHSAYALGASKGRLIVAAFGGAELFQVSDSLNIGKRNHLAMRKILWKAGVLVTGEDVGGTAPRTVRFEVASGRIVVSSGRELREFHAGKYKEKRPPCHGTY